MKVMKRVAEIKAKREAQFYKNRCLLPPPPPYMLHTSYMSSRFCLNRMAIGKEKNRKSRTAKKLVTAKRDAAYVPSTQLLQPIESLEPTKMEKIKVPVSKKRSALVPGEGRSMGMDLD